MAAPNRYDNPMPTGILTADICLLLLGFLMGLVKRFHLSRLRRKANASNLRSAQAAAGAIKRRSSTTIA